MSQEEKIKRQEENSYRPSRKTNYKLGFFADSKKVDIESLKATLATFFPYHLIAANSKIEKIAKQIANDYACQITDVHGDTVEEIFSDMKRNRPDYLFVVWDGESEDGSEFLRLAHKAKIDTYIFYER